MKKFEILKKIGLRLVLALLALTLLGSLLCGCAGQQATNRVVELSKVEVDETNSLSNEDIKLLAEFIVNHKRTDKQKKDGMPTAYEAFVAAYRGYDMLAKDYDLNAEEFPMQEPKVEAAKNLLKTYDTEGKSLASIDYSGLTVSDMESVIQVLKSPIEKESSRNFFENLQYWIGVALGAITNTIGFGNYLVGICIFAILFEILLIPLSIKQQKNSIKQAKLRPKEMAIRRKYAGRNDQATQQKIQQEIQELYQRENFNPMGGCLPMLLQLPIILVLYNIVVDPIRYTLGLSTKFSAALTTFYATAKEAGGLGGTVASDRGTIELLSHIKNETVSAFAGLKDFLFLENGAECYTWLEEISDKIPSFSLGSLNFGMTPSFTEFNWLWLIPIITFAIYFGSMKLTKKFTYQPTAATNDAQMGCSNKIMDFSMPLMSVYISFMVPATISVYWIFKSLLGTLKQFILSRTMPIPPCTDEDIKAAEREMKGKKHSNASASARPSSNGQKPRSLHHIDDEDELPPPTPKNTKKAKEEAPEAETQTENKDAAKPEAPDSPIEQAPVKDDSDKPTKDK